MKILGIDTSTKYLCLGVYDGFRIYEYSLETDRKLSALITISIKRVLDALNLKVKDIDYFSCGLGPGSFTGVRTGLSTIKGLSWAVNKPVIGISSLDILAKNVSLTSAPIVPIIDAKRNLIYASVFKYRNGSLRRIKPYSLLKQKELLKDLEPGSIVLGDAVSLYREKLLQEIKGITILEKDYWYPKAYNIIALAIEKIREKKLGNPFDIKPIYLYPKECQVKGYQLKN